MTKIKWKEIREWLLVLIAIETLIVMVLGLRQIEQINVNLKEVSAERINADQVIIRDTVTNDTVCQHYYNGTFWFGGNCT